MNKIKHKIWFQFLFLYQIFSILSKYSLCKVAWVDWIFCNFLVNPLLILLPWISIVGRPYNNNNNNNVCTIQFK